MVVVDEVRVVLVVRGVDERRERGRGGEEAGGEGGYGPESMPGRSVERMEIAIDRDDEDDVE